MARTVDILGDVVDPARHEGLRVVGFALETEDLIARAREKLKAKGMKKQLIQAPGIDESCACNRCPYMRLNTLEKLYRCLRDLAPEVTVPEEIQVRARKPIERMLALG